MQKVIIDLEFSGLDNTFVNDNEIIQVKLLNAKTAKATCNNYRSKKRLGAYAYLTHRITRYPGTYFGGEEFRSMLEQIGVNPQRKTIYYGFGTQQDQLMLQKYGVEIDIIDLREMCQRSRHEVRLAKEGSGLESCYFIVTGKLPKLDSHDGLNEIFLIYELYKKAIRLRKKDKLTVMPHGHCAGMPINEYVMEYRRAADGYRYNNDDLLAESLTAAIPIRHYDDWDDDDWDDDDWDDDDWDDDD